MSKAAAVVRGAGGGRDLRRGSRPASAARAAGGGYEVMDCVPDIVAMGKPMGAGLPLSGVGARADIANHFHAKAFYFNTTAATPLQAAVGSAVLDVIEEEQLLANVGAVGGYLKDRLAGLVDRIAGVGDVRGHGLFLGIDWVADRATRKPDREGAADIVERMKEKGYLISNAGRFRNVLKIRPPLVFGREHADELFGALARGRWRKHPLDDAARRARKEALTAPRAQRVAALGPRRRAPRTALAEREHGLPGGGRQRGGVRPAGASARLPQP